MGKKIIPSKLKIGDEIRIVAPSDSLATFHNNYINKAYIRLIDKGYKVTFSKNSREMNNYNSSSIKARVSDLHEAFLDKNVKAILTAVGGFNVNQILDYLDYDIIAMNPKIICGFSDITALINAIYAKTGLVTYHGVHFSTFMFENEYEYTEKYFDLCLTNENAYSINTSINYSNKWNYDKNEVELIGSSPYQVVHSGRCKGEVVGGNLCTLNLLQGTKYMPSFDNKILFLEEDNIVREYFKMEFDRNLQSLIQSMDFGKVKGIVLGRFENSSLMDIDTIRNIICTKEQLNNIPVVCNVDFGHTAPIITFPIGGTASLDTQNEVVEINIIEH